MDLFQGGWRRSFFFRNQAECQYRLDESIFSYIVNPLRGLFLIVVRVSDGAWIEAVVSAMGQAIQIVAGVCSFSMMGELQRYMVWMIAGMLLFCAWFIF